MRFIKLAVVSSLVAIASCKLPLEKRSAVIDTGASSALSDVDSTYEEKKNLAGDLSVTSKISDEEDLMVSIKDKTGSGNELPGTGTDSNSESGAKASDPFLMSISMIVVSEIGDKTFLIAALMAMKASRVLVFSAAFAALAIMTVLSGIVGHALPALIPQKYTQFAAGVLFVVFGVKLAMEAMTMPKEGGVEEEMAEVEEEIAMNDINQRMDQTESGANGNSGNSQNGANSKGVVGIVQQLLVNIKDLFSFVLSPLWVQVFVMTFLGEWGDRSQIATIAMAAGSDYWAVIAGAVVGHGICTGGAVIGGKLLATKISIRNVTLGGAIAFIIFAFLYFYDALTADNE